jgi:7-cyano-7-deazaguanine synthase in queuosine biosynthesis
MSQEVVIWSGGADSTYLLHKLLTNSTQHWPVIALSIDKHTQLHQGLLEKQREARENYKAFVKKKHVGFLKHRVVRVETDAALDIGSQVALWISSLVPYVGKGQELNFGYIRGDTFWHERRHAVAMIEAIHSIHYYPNDEKITVKYPIEWMQKHEVLEGLKKFGVPNKCWWSCEKPENGKACGRCDKCLELEVGRFVLNGSRTYRRINKPGKLLTKAVDADVKQAPQLDKDFQKKNEPAVLGVGRSIAKKRSAKRKRKS